MVQAARAWRNKAHWIGLDLDRNCAPGRRNLELVAYSQPVNILGVITNGEEQGTDGLRRNFQRLDTNRGGGLSKEEYDAATVHIIRELQNLKDPLHFRAAEA